MFSIPTIVTIAIVMDLIVRNVITGKFCVGVPNNQSITVGNGRELSLNTGDLAELPMAFTCSNLLINLISVHVLCTELCSLPRNFCTTCNYRMGAITIENKDFDFGGVIKIAQLVH